MLQEPDIHPNGSGRKELLAQFRAADEAIEGALEVIFRIAPHGRDYYTLGEGAYGRARSQHDERVRAMLTIQMDYRKLYERTKGQ